MVGIPLTRPDYHGEFRGRVVGAIEAAVAEADVESEIVVSPATHMQGLAGVVEATNFLARKCVVEGYDFLWIVEADVEVPRHALVRLLSDVSDISLGIYPNHRPDGLRMMAGYFQEHPDRVKPLVHSVFGVDQLRGKVFSGMVWAGIGCVLIRRGVFESLRFVYSEHEFRLKVGVHDQLFLFEAQQRFGFRVLLRGDVLCGHLPEWPLQKLEEVNSGC
jgi:hypothetical protein